MAVIDMTAFAPESVQTPVITAQASPGPTAKPVEEKPQEPKPPAEAITVVGVTPDEFALLDSLYQSYLRFLKASKEQAQAAKDLGAAQTAFDACQGETKGAKEAFEVILKSLPDELVKIRDPQATAMIEAVRDLAATETMPECAKEAISRSQAYEAWTKESTQKIVDAGVPGLGKKKADLLVEKFPTIGDLEASRAEAAESRVHWSKKLPKGFGVDVADAIYDAMAKLLRQIETASESGGDPVASIVQDDTSDSSEPSLAVDPEPAPPVVSDIDAADELEYEDFDEDDDDELPFEDESESEASEVDSEPESNDISALEWIESIYNEITENTREALGPEPSR
jgi:hypothetical protein